MVGFPHTTLVAVQVPPVDPSKPPALIIPIDIPLQRVGGASGDAAVRLALMLLAPPATVFQYVINMLCDADVNLSMLPGQTHLIVHCSDCCRSPACTAWIDGVAPAGLVPLNVSGVSPGIVPLADGITSVTMTHCTTCMRRCHALPLLLP